MIPKESTQRQWPFFCFIAEKYYPNTPSSFVKDLQVHLSLSPQPIYNRINGKTLLDHSEISLLLEVYDAPITILLPNAKITPPIYLKNNHTLRAATQHHVV